MRPLPGVASRNRCSQAELDRSYLNAGALGLLLRGIQCHWLATPFPFFARLFDFAACNDFPYRLNPVAADGDNFVVEMDRTIGITDDEFHPIANSRGLAWYFKLNGCMFRGELEF